MSKKTIREARVKEMEKRRYPAKHYVSGRRRLTNAGSWGSEAAMHACRACRDVVALLRMRELGRGPGGEGGVGGGVNYHQTARDYISRATSAHVSYKPTSLCMLWCVDVHVCSGGGAGLGSVPFCMKMVCFPHAVLVRGWG